MPDNLSASWRGYRVDKPGSPIPSVPAPHGESLAALDWRDDPRFARLLVVTGDSFVVRRGAGFTAVGSAVDDPQWKGYWTAHDYVRNLDQLEDAFKLARVTSGNDDVLGEAYAYEAEIHIREAQEILFMDQLSECHLTSRRAFDVFNLLSTRAASNRFRTVVSVASLTAPVANHEASRALSELFNDPVLSYVIHV